MVREFVFEREAFTRTHTEVVTFDENRLDPGRDERRGRHWSGTSPRDQWWTRRHGIFVEELSENIGDFAIGDRWPVGNYGVVLHPVDESPGVPFDSGGGHASVSKGRAGVGSERCLCMVLVTTPVTRVATTEMMKDVSDADIQLGAWKPMAVST